LQPESANGHCTNGLIIACSGGLEGLEDARLEASAVDLAPGEPLQFERLGYFTPDPDSLPERPVFNRAVTLRDTWARLEKQFKRD